jgi:DNA-directed RNA polymerase beta subunit
MGYYLSVRNSEGASVGLVKNMAMMSSITISSNSINIREVIKDLGTVIFSHVKILVYFKNTKIIINGDRNTFKSIRNYSQNSKY